MILKAFSNLDDSVMLFYDNRMFEDSTAYPGDYTVYTQ